MKRSSIYLPTELDTVALLVTAAVDAVVSCERIADAISTASSDGFEAAKLWLIPPKGFEADIDEAVLGANGAVGVASCKIECGVVSCSVTGGCSLGTDSSDNKPSPEAGCPPIGAVGTLIISSRFANGSLVCWLLAAGISGAPSSEPLKRSEIKECNQIFGTYRGQVAKADKYSKIYKYIDIPIDAKTYIKNAFKSFKYIVLFVRSCYNKKRIR